MGDASLQTYQEDRCICLDRGGTTGFRKPQSIIDIGPNPRRSRTGRTPPPLHTANNHVVSAALIVEREESGHPLKVQQLVYFVSEVLTDTKA